MRKRSKLSCLLCLLWWLIWHPRPHNIYKKMNHPEAKLCELNRSKELLSIFLEDSLLLTIGGTKGGRAIICPTSLSLSQWIQPPLKIRISSMSTHMLHASDKHSYFYTVKVWFSQPVWICKVSSFMVKLWSLWLTLFKIINF